MQSEAVCFCQLGWLVRDFNLIGDKMNLKHWVILFVGIFALEIAINYFRDYDDTDDEASRVRSGMQLFTDNKTGCQYLKASYFAELTKRVDGNGAHVGCH